MPDTDQKNNELIGELMAAFVIAADMGDEEISHGSDIHKGILAVLERLPTVTVKSARRVMADAFAADPGFRQEYVANVAMLLHDNYGITDHEMRNKAGDEIVWLLFEV